MTTWSRGSGYRPTSIRCVIALAEIALLVGIALLASATATGVEFDLVGASQRLPVALLHLLGWAGGIALLILPIALAIRLLMVTPVPTGWARRWQPAGSQSAWWPWSTCC